MAYTFIFVVLLYCTSVKAVLPTFPVYLYPEHRADEKISTNSYEFKIIPNDNPVAKYEEQSLYEYSITAIAKIGSTALAIAKWIFLNGVLVLIGAALVVGLCAYTPYCTLIIKQQVFRDLHNLNIPYLDNIEHYFSEAYRKYQSMQISY